MGPSVQNLFTSPMREPERRFSQTKTISHFKLLVAEKVTQIEDSINLHPMATTSLRVTISIKASNNKDAFQFSQNTPSPILLAHNTRMDFSTTIMRKGFHLFEMYIYCAH